VVGVRVSIAVVLLAGCAIDEAGLMPREDAGVDVVSFDANEAAMQDANAAVADVHVDSAPPTCNLDAPFGNVTDVAGTVNTGAWEDSPSLTSDELTMFFMRINGSALGLTYATRASALQAFSSVSAVASISNTSTNDTAPFVVDGFSVLYFSSQRNGTTNYHLYEAAGKGSPDGWSNITPLSALNGTDLSTDTQPWVSATSGVWFTSNRYGSYGLFQAASTTSVPLPYTGLDTPAADAIHPVLSADGLSIYFASDAGGYYRVYVATRGSTSGFFGAPTVLPAFDLGASNNKPGWLSIDGCRMYFSSDRGGGQGNWDIWVASRP
jgi:WD40-like Beta Propeller Repeat